MRSTFIRAAGIAAMLATAATLSQPAAADTGGRLHDVVYADNFGNLIVYSPGGYKRIVVGQGHLAKQLTEYMGTTSPSVVTLDDGGRDCYRPPVFVKGRSYMYGLADGEMPQLGGRCD